MKVVNVNIPVTSVPISVVVILASMFDIV